MSSFGTFIFIVLLFAAFLCALWYALSAIIWLITKPFHSRNESLDTQPGRGANDSPRVMPNITFKSSNARSVEEYPRSVSTIVSVPPSQLGDSAPDYQSHDRQKPCIIFLDVETTGLSSKDRIVSIGCVAIKALPPFDRSHFDFLHLIFDPCRDCHPKAAQVHGYDDWTLGHQETFRSRCDEVVKFLSQAGLVVAHNASFDLSFVDRELIAHGKQPLSMPSYCTMEAYREEFFGDSAALSAICKEIGLRRSRKHSALEDAWLAMQVFLWVRGHQLCPCDLSDFADATPTNFIAPPPRPGQAPKKRSPRKKPVS
jgi:DNA polymerase-3 subunit epsilon